MEEDATTHPQVRPRRQGDKIAPKLVDHTDKLHGQAIAMKKGSSPPGDESGTGSAADASGSDHQPAGGFDNTPIPHAPPGYTLRFTFHRGDNLPFADFGSFSSDPYIVAHLSVNLPQRHKQDPGLTFRTPTVRKNLDPVWDSEWVVANVPASGFELKCVVFDEDAADHDDKLGNAYVQVNSINENWPGIQEQKFKVKKRMGSKRVYIFGNLAAFTSRRNDPGSYVIISVECLGKTPGNEGGQVYTQGPNYWFKHFSPLIGRLAGTKDEVHGQDGKKSISRYKYVYASCCLLLFFANPVCPASKRSKSNSEAPLHGNFTIVMSNLDRLWPVCSRRRVCAGGSLTEPYIINMSGSITLIARLKTDSFRRRVMK